MLMSFISEAMIAVAEQIVWAGDTVSQLRFTLGSPVTATATFQFDTDGGTRSRTGTAPLSNDSDWCDSHPNTTGSDYDLQTGTITGSNGSYTGLASNTIYTLGTGRNLEVTITADYEIIASRTIPIRIYDAGSPSGTYYNLQLSGRIAV